MGEASGDVVALVNNDIEVLTPGWLEEMVANALRPGVGELPYAMANLLLEIRILDVRAFLVFDNLTGIRTAADIPERPLPGSRLYYGLRWTFRN